MSVLLPRERSWAPTRPPALLPSSFCPKMCRESGISLLFPNKPALTLLFQGRSQLGMLHADLSASPFQPEPFLEGSAGSSPSPRAMGTTEATLRMENVDVKEEWQDEDFPRCVPRKAKTKPGEFKFNSNFFPMRNHQSGRVHLEASEATGA